MINHERNIIFNSMYLLRMSSPPQKSIFSQVLMFVPYSISKRLQKVQWKSIEDPLSPT